ncbi:MAG: hypothetical protein ABEI53_00695 [Candidatus Magasanikbacteria bacterium]
MKQALLVWIGELLFFTAPFFLLSIIPVNDKRKLLGCWLDRLSYYLSYLYLFVQYSIVFLSIVSIIAVIFEPSKASRIFKQTALILTMLVTALLFGSAYLSIQEAKDLVVDIEQRFSIMDYLIKIRQFFKRVR